MASGRYRSSGKGPPGPSTTAPSGATFAGFAESCDDISGSIVNGQLRRQIGPRLAQPALAVGSPPRARSYFNRGHSARRGPSQALDRCEGLVTGGRGLLLDRNGNAHAGLILRGAAAPGARDHCGEGAL